ncbi:MAG: DUF294 nucleotidyltransferase-like domain-containing protein [bacterium]
MHEIIEEACKKLNVELPNVRESSEIAQNMIREAQEYLIGQVPPMDVPVDGVVLGSLARHEVTPGSDLDYVVIVHNLPDYK